VIARPDAIVVGAGIVGAAVADALALDGLRVLVLDGAEPGAATSGGMGHVVVMDDSDAQFELSKWSLQLMQELAPALPAACEVDAPGTLWLAEDDAQLELARDKLRHHTDRGVHAELLDAAALRDAEPSVREGLAGALWVPDDLVIYQPVVAQWLLQRVVERGGVVARARVERIDTGPGSASVTTDERRLEAGLIVNAAGAWAPALTPGLDIRPRKGHLAITDRYPTVCRHQLVELGYLGSAHGLGSESVALNLQPRRSGQMLIGSSREFAGWDASLNRDVLARMLARAVSFVPMLADMNVIRCWTAFRPATPDHLPCIGRAPAQPNVYVAAGHEGLGITLALATGRLLADMIAGRAPPVDPAPFDPARFAKAAA
jgi:D-hydroxyproline dehydrogenase subunit beta